MVAQWYFAQAGKTFGPFSAAYLKELAAAGQIEPRDTVWKEGMEKGVPASRVEHLFPNRPVQALPGGPAAPATVPPPSQSPSPMSPVLDTASTPPPSPPTAQPTPLAAALTTPGERELAAQEDSPSTGTAPLPPAKAPGAGLPEVPAPPPHQPEVRHRRVLGVKGGVLMSQDGLVAKFRKKCLRCGYADTSLTTTPIRGGVTRVNFFCPKCRKNQQVEIQGVG